MAVPAKTCQVVSQADSQQINPVSALSLNPFVVGSLMIPHRETTTETTITGLDVYKRQIIGRAVVFFVIAEDCNEITGLIRNQNFMDNSRFIV